jgi:hypothetical protein
VRAARFLALVALALPPTFAAGQQMPGRAYEAPGARVDSLRVSQAGTVFRWDAPVEKVTAADDPRRLRVGSVRAAPKEFADLAWQPVAEGYVARFDVSSAGAVGIRVRLDLAGMGGVELRVRGSTGGVEAMRVAPGAAQAWGPWTEGAIQELELFSPLRPAPGAARVGAVVHFDQPLDAKAAASCTIDTPCTTGNTTLDAAIAERKKSIARINFVDGASSFVCTGTLINTEKFPAAYFLTANHCIGRDAVAASISTDWFYEATACASGQASALRQQVAGGMSIVFADPNNDQTLLLMNAAPPSGAVYSGWDATKLADGNAVVSLSHPTGDVSKWALASVVGTGRTRAFEQPLWLTQFSRGIIQGGSSGSGLFTLSGNSLILRAVLFGATTNAGGLSCTSNADYGLYSRFDVFYPEIARYIQANPAPVTDDHGNRPFEATAVAAGSTETTVRGRIDYLGDVDVLRIDVATAGTLVIRSEGGIDTVGVLLDANGERITSNDDAQASALDFGITWRVAAGTYYLAITHWESAGTGDYTVRVSMLNTAENYTDLWWNEAEPGWGINLNHQGQILFATLFTYETGGAPLWLVLANGAKQADGSFQGTLYRMSGPAFNAPWTPATPTEVGTMRLAFTGAYAGRLTYTVNGVTVAKDIQRQRFSPKTTVCSWSVFDRTYALNFQDLWWNPGEPGWGVNFAHQGNTLFATLFTYGADRKGVWYVMSDGPRQGDVARYSGTLYRTTGPAFDTVPWTPATPTGVGTMSVAFADGNNATLTYAVNGVTVTKKIERQVFSSPMTQCEAADE